MPSPTPPSPDELLLRCHFVYEVKMLWGTYQRFVEDDVLKGDQVIRNALIESFCVHARNLIEFFEQHTRKFVYPDYRPFSSVTRDRIKTVETRLNNQISHLGLGRTIGVSEKIDISERAEIINILSAEIARFKAKLTGGYKDLQLPDLPSVTPPETATDRASSTTSSVFITVVPLFEPNQKDA